MFRTGNGPLVRRLYRDSSRHREVINSVPSNEDEALIECGWLAYPLQSSLLAEGATVRCAEWFVSDEVKPLAGKKD